MSTRAMYTFIDEGKTAKSGYHVFKHHDGYPSGAARHIGKALPHAWNGGRFEADEFAAAFVAGNKSPYINEELEILRRLEALGEAIATEKSGREIIELRQRLPDARVYALSSSGGGVRLLHSGSVYAVAPCDIEYRYEITSIKGELLVTCYATNYFDKRTKNSETLEFHGTFAAFKAWAAAP